MGRMIGAKYTRQVWRQSALSRIVLTVNYTLIAQFLPKGHADGKTGKMSFMLCNGVCWFLYHSVSGTDLRGQSYVMPHWNRSCWSKFPSQSVTAYLHQASQSQRWPYNARRLVGSPLEHQPLSHWYDSTRKKISCDRETRTRSVALDANALQPGQRGGILLQDNANDVKLRAAN